MLRRVVWLKLTDVSEVLTASNIRAIAVNTSETEIVQYLLWSNGTHTHAIYLTETHTKIAGIK
jgi:hypothetical protein